jgi:hypothetical protein
MDFSIGRPEECHRIGATRESLRPNCSRAEYSVKENLGSFWGHILERFLIVKKKG